MRRCYRHDGGDGRGNKGWPERQSIREPIRPSRSKPTLRRVTETCPTWSMTSRQPDGMRSAVLLPPVDADSGRLDTRHDGLASDMECIGVTGSWRQMTRRGRIESPVEREGTVSIEPGECLTSLPGEVERVAHAVRPHGGIDHSTPQGA